MPALFMRIFGISLLFSFDQSFYLLFVRKINFMGKMLAVSFFYTTDVSDNPSWFLSRSRTDAPASANLWAIALSIPEAAPVTKTLVPLKSNESFNVSLFLAILTFEITTRANYI
jgi:hypothetical protein